MRHAAAYIAGPIVSSISAYYSSYVHGDELRAYP
jgi:hypothetical protein